MSPHQNTHCARVPAGAPTAALTTVKTQNEMRNI